MAGRETPATRAAKAAGVPFTVHEERHDTRAEPCAGEAAHALGLDPRRVLKTLVVSVGDELAVAIVPAADQLDLRGIGKRAALGDAARGEAGPGYLAGR